jgi:hypothetical protein
MEFTNRLPLIFRFFIPNQSVEKLDTDQPRFQQDELKELIKNQKSRNNLTQVYYIDSDKKIQSKWVQTCSE